MYDGSKKPNLCQLETKSVSGLPDMSGGHNDYICPWRSLSSSNGKTRCKALRLLSNMACCQVPGETFFCAFSLLLIRDSMGATARCRSSCVWLVTSPCPSSALMRSKAMVSAFSLFFCRVCCEVPCLNFTLDVSVLLIIEDTAFLASTKSPCATPNDFTSKIPTFRLAA